MMKIHSVADDLNSVLNWSMAKSVHQDSTMSASSGGTKKLTLIHSSVGTKSTGFILLFPQHPTQADESKKLQRILHSSLLLSSQPTEL
jgi:hypothetical protein